MFVCLNMGSVFIVYGTLLSGIPKLKVSKCQGNSNPPLFQVKDTAAGGGGNLSGAPFPSSSAGSSRPSQFRSCFYCAPTVKRRNRFDS